MLLLQRAVALTDRLVIWPRKLLASAGAVIGFFTASTIVQRFARRLGDQTISATTWEPITRATFCRPKRSTKYQRDPWKQERRTELWGGIGPR